MTEPLAPAPFRVALTFDAELAHVSMRISSFGEDKDGELYVCDYGGGRILQIVP